MWEKPRDGCRYISARDIVHALGNSDQYPFPLGRRPKTPEIRRMVDIRKGGVAVIAVQYEDGEVMQYTFDREGRVA